MSTKPALSSQKEHCSALFREESFPCSDATTYMGFALRPGGQSVGTSGAPNDSRRAPYRNELDTLRACLRRSRSTSSSLPFHAGALLCMHVRAMLPRRHLGRVPLAARTWSISEQVERGRAGVMGPRPARARRCRREAPKNMREARATADLCAHAVSGVLARALRRTSPKSALFHTRRPRRAAGHRRVSTRKVRFRVEGGAASGELADLIRRCPGSLPHCLASPRAKMLAT
jgi:hypothetical protein